MSFYFNVDCHSPGVTPERPSGRGKNCTPMHAAQICAREVGYETGRAGGVARSLILWVASLIESVHACAEGPWASSLKWNFDSRVGYWGTSAGFLGWGEGETKVSRGPSVTLAEWTASRVKKTGRDNSNPRDVNPTFPRSAAHQGGFHQAPV